MHSHAIPRVPNPEIEVLQLRELLERSALRPVEQSVFLVFWILAHGGGRSLVEGRLVDAAVAVLAIAGFDRMTIREWMSLAPKLGFSEQECVRIQEGLLLSSLLDLEGVNSHDFEVAAVIARDRKAEAYGKDLRELAYGRPVSLVEIAQEKATFKQQQRANLLTFFAELDRPFQKENSAALFQDRRVG